MVIALSLEAIIILAIISLNMQCGGPAARGRGLNTFSLEAEAGSASPDKKNGAKARVTKERQRTITPPIPKPLLLPANPLKARRPGSAQIISR